MERVGRRARIGYREGSVHRSTRSSNHTRRLVPTTYAKRAIVHLGHEQVVAKISVFDGKLIEAAPVASGFYEREPDPRFPL
ncbi:hypothetical protein WM32_09345 [Burkholderia ubonensis]|nr:hypothetical protein WM32_09345 [Burkholderia ubonensis]